MSESTSESTSRRVDRIVYIGAVGRSGTTLVERTLATSRTVVALGEMVHLWDRGVRDDEPCGCGSAFSACPFWQAVGQRAFGGWDRVDLDSIAHDRNAVDRNRYIPLLMFPRLAPRRFRVAHARLVDVLDRLYGAAHAEAAAADPDVVLVDSSKHPSYLYLLRTVPARPIHLLHVVRDPRGVANSWAKHVERPESGEGMEQLGLARACARWTSHNLLFQLAGLLGVPRRRLSYERFTRRPGEVGDRVDELVPGPSVQPLAVDGSDVMLGTDHTVSGNPMRFASGAVTVRSDDTWRRAMPRWHQLVVGTLTTPLRQVYAR
jgi:hypothetical protein